MNVTKEQADKVIAALETTYFREIDIPAREQALSIMRGLAEDAEPKLLGATCVCGRSMTVTVSPQAAPQPTQPAECKNGCPPLQICDFCQGTGGKDKPPQAAQTEAALSEVVRLSEDAGLYSADFQTEAQEREAFEEFMLTKYPTHLCHWVGDQYSEMFTRLVFVGWKAGRAGSKP